MKDKLRELAERWKRYDSLRMCANELLAILDAEGDGGSLSGEVVGSLNINRYRGCDSMVNHDFDYYGNLKDGTYNLYTHPARSGVVSDEDVEAACEAYEDVYEAEIHLGSPTYTDNKPQAMRAALEHFAKTPSEDVRDAERYRWLRDHSQPSACAFYLSVGMALHGIRFEPQTVDSSIDAAMKGERHER